jgi:ribosomal protein L33
MPLFIRLESTIASGQITTTISKKQYPERLIFIIPCG